MNSYEALLRAFRDQIIVFNEGEHLLIVYRTWSSNCSICQEISRFDAILDRPGTFCLDLMCSVFLIRELVSILWHSFTDETLTIFCLLHVCL